MAVHTIPLLGSATLPDTSGNVTPEPAAVSQTNDRYPGLWFKFADTATRDKLGFSFRVPDNYVGTAKIVLRWLVTVTSGKVAWDIDYTAVADGETGDPSTDQETVNDTTGVTVPGTARLEKETSIVLTSANLAVGDLVQGVIARDGTDAADTAAGSAYLLAAFFQYADV